MMKRLVREITALQQNKSRLQLRVERYNLWWKNLNDWSIIISEPYFNSNQGIEFFLVISFVYRSFILKLSKNF